MNWTERCWAQVDLRALRRNYRRLRGLLSPRQKYLAVVKANAYGHGAVPVAWHWLGRGIWQGSIGINH